MAINDQAKLYKELESKKFQPIYFLFGDEPYLLNQCTHRFKFSVLDENTVDFNYSIFYAADAEVTNIKDAVETLPVFSSHRLVILKNAHELKDAELLELQPLFDNPVPSTVFVILAEKVDKRKKAIKTLLENAFCVEFKKPYDNQIPQWISYLCQNVSLKISNEAIHRLHRLVGNNLSELENQLFKIQDYLGERTQIELTDINAVVSFSREESVFDFTKAIGQKDRVKALEQLVALLDQGQNEVAIISLLARHMRLLLTVRSGLDQGIGGAKLASLTQVPSYFIESYCDQARIWPIRKIEEAISVLHETDKALKSSPLSSHIWLENMVLKSCSL
ncbi:MAG: DNA polymerase III subunit delta [Bdellovibrionaceae bacterium]|nr:DNA polymerase III subunit delta [Bdellovibrio sp.]